MLDRDDVLRARETLRGRIVVTPTIDSPELGARLKCELFQRTGSFKARGALNKITALTPNERARGVITISAGNHAQAVAWAAAAEHVDALVVMTATAAPHKVAATRAYGATVDQQAATGLEAFERVHALTEQTGRIFIHPHEDPLVLAGAGTIALELEEDVPDADAIVVPVGGGGLIAGIQVAAQNRTRVIAVEPEGSPALHAAVAAGHPVPVPANTIAEGLSPPQLGRLPLELCAHLERHLVTEAELEEGFRFLYDRAKLAAEPSGAAAVAAILGGKIQAENAVAIVSGGNTAPEIASAILVSR